MNEWLSDRAAALAGATNAGRDSLELAPADIELVLDVAGYAAHDSGARTNAPLLCYLLGIARAAGAQSLAELAEIVRSTS
ncbi:MAG: DUF6457 domain-containing protein [Gaiellaceae bacterium]